MASQFTKLLHAYNVGAVISLIGAGLAKYYAAFARYTPWADEGNPDALEYSEREIFRVQKELLLGKRLSVTDTAFMIKKRFWSSNTVFTQYDHRVDLRNKDFYVLNSANNVYKCLFNNYGANSTVEPTTVSTEPFTTVGDGYIWKYMFTLTSASDQKFSSDAYFPIVANTSVIGSAVPGAIHAVLIEESGTQYVVEEGTVQEVVSNTMFRIQSSASSSNNFYVNSAATIIGGTGEGGQSIITGYHINSLGKFVTTASNLGVDPTSQYSIGPRLTANGNGTDFVAYVSEVNDTTGAIESAIVLNPGSGYDYVDEFKVTSFSGSGARLVPILSPTGGHGSQPAEELLCDLLGISVQVANNEGTTIPDDVSFRTAVLILNPKTFNDPNTDYTANTFNALYELSLTGATGSFTVGERVRGLTSAASGQVASANASLVRLSAVQGTFATSEVIQGANGLVTATTTAINNPDINPTSGKVLFISNVLKVDRAADKTENLKMYARF